MNMTCKYFERNKKHNWIFWGTINENERNETDVYQCYNCKKKTQVPSARAVRYNWINY